MKQIEKLEGDWIGHPCSPAVWMQDEPDYKKITKILITAGGGMGGSKWYEYVVREDDIQSNTIQDFMRIDGKPIKINTSYVVEVENYTLVSAKFDTSNPNFRKDYREVQFLVEDDIEVELRHGYYHDLKRR